MRLITIGARLWIFRYIIGPLFPPLSQKSHKGSENFHSLYTHKASRRMCWLLLHLNAARSEYLLGQNETKGDHRPIGLARK